MDFEAREATVFQRNEITEHYIYKNFVGRISGVKNRRIISQIADDEMRHYTIWKSYTQKDVNPDRLKIWFYNFVSSLFGVFFGIKLMEKSEKAVHALYSRIPGSYKEINGIIRDEEEHEQALTSLIDEDLLKSTAHLVLGFNNALIEIAGILAGLTFALQKTNLVAITALVAGIAATLSMTVSRYLAVKSDYSGKNPFMTALSTGIAYIIVVVLLVFPYLLFSNIYLCLGISLVSAFCVMGLFSYYISVCRDILFKSRLLEVVSLSIAVAAMSALAGYGLHFLYVNYM
jgi:vacuolar iron transporter family protein